MPTPRELFLLMFNPAMLRDNVEWDRIQNQAKLVGVQKTFNMLWAAELYRSRNYPGVCLTPREILQLACATHRPEND